MPIRADQLLVRQGLASSRTLAARLIAAGRVHCGQHLVRKASETLAEDTDLQVAAGEEDRYVSRGGLKLAGALREGAIDPRGLLCLDVGQSTGGFTDCLLQAGAARVVGIDVGHSQLHPRLRGDPRVVCIEGCNARWLAADGAASEPVKAALDGPLGGTRNEHLRGLSFALIVVDVSFISLTLVLPALTGLAASQARLAALVKPQFEVGPQGLDRHGIVRDPDHFPRIRDQVIACASASGWQTQAWLDSPIPGGDGNREFFLIARRADDIAGRGRPSSALAASGSEQSS